MKHTVLPGDQKKNRNIRETKTKTKGSAARKENIVKMMVFDGRRLIVIEYHV